MQIDENDQSMSSMVQVTMQWKDMFLKWSDKGYLKTVDFIQVHQEDIWVPDITVDNVIMADWHMG